MQSNCRSPVAQTARQGSASCVEPSPSWVRSSAQNDLKARLAVLALEDAVWVLEPARRLGPGCDRSARCRGRAGAGSTASPSGRASCQRPRRSPPAAAQGNRQSRPAGRGRGRRPGRRRGRFRAAPVRWWRRPPSSRRRARCGRCGARRPRAQRGGRPRVARPLRRMRSPCGCRAQAGEPAARDASSNPSDARTPRSRQVGAEKTKLRVKLHRPQYRPSGGCLMHMQVACTSGCGRLGGLN
jgi:hypothetical protein